MRDAVDADARRHAQRRAVGGHPATLSSHVLGALVERAAMEPGLIDDVIWASDSHVEEETFDIARPEQLAGVGDRRDRRPAVRLLPAGCVLRRRRCDRGQPDVVLAGGTEFMSRVPLGLPRGTRARSRNRFQKRYDVAANQGIGAEMITERRGLSRAELVACSVAVERYMREAQVTQIFEGTNQIQPLGISRQLAR